MKRTGIIFILFHLTIWANAQISEIGLASFYDDKFQGRVTASGELFDQNLFTAAHRTLPFGTMVKVINLENKKTVEVRINDRGPFINNRVIDLSSAAAKVLGFFTKGTAKIKIEVISLGDNALSTTTTSPPEKKGSPNETQKSENTTPSKVPLTAVVIENKAKSTIANEALEYYQIATTVLEPSGFAIQIASYQEAANLMKLCCDVQAKIQANILVQVSENQDKKLYRVMVGPIDSRQKAEVLFQKLEKQFPGCFILSL